MARRAPPDRIERVRRRGEHGQGVRGELGDAVAPTSLLHAPAAAQRVAQRVHDARRAIESRRGARLRAEELACVERRRRELLSEGHVDGVVVTSPLAPVKAP